VDDALRRGKISYCKVRAITRVATPVNEELLVGQAEFTTGAQMEKICAKYAAVLRSEKRSPRLDRERRHVRRRNLEDGMVRIEAVVFAEEAAAIMAALDRVAAERCRAPEGASSSVPAETRVAVASAAAVTTGATAGSAIAPPIDAATVATGATAGTGVTATAPESVGKADSAAASATGARTAAAVSQQPRAFDRADALVEIAEAIVRGTSRQRSPIEVVLTVPVHGLLVNPGEKQDPLDAAHFADGTCVSAETARRLCCDAGIVQLVEDADGNPLSIGRKTRTIPGSMKRALLHRDGTCRFPGCTNTVFLQGHHIQHWADGGETSTRNLLCLCSFHHLHLHEYGFTVAVDEKAGFVFRDPRGRLVPAVPVAAAPAELGWPAIEEQNRELDIRAEALPPGWNGVPVNWSWVIRDITATDERAARATTA
jgi:hypothetical protein